MSILKIRKYGDPILRAKAESVKEIDGEITELVDSLVETMYAASGVGLAAPQVGVPKRVIVIDTSQKEAPGQFLVLINPVIVESEGEGVLEEGCLSIPEVTGEVKRATRVVVQGKNRSGRELEVTATELLARALQHEIDHLDGILFIDRMNPIKRREIKDKLKELKRMTKRELGA